MGELALDLVGPVGSELARAVEHLPGQHGLPGGSQFELKWDGFRAGAVRRGGEVRLWSRNGKDFTAKFPDVQKALAAQVDVDCVLDGELECRPAGATEVVVLVLPAPPPDRLAGNARHQPSLFDQACRLEDLLNDRRRQLG